MINSSTQHTEQLSPFGNIGMAFSGGGFRAAAFSLGTLSYLQRLQLDEKPVADHITYISSASGGTITNLLYTSALHSGKSFADFYEEAKRALRGDRLLEEVLVTLNNDLEWNLPGQDKRRNLINSFAKVYDRMLFQGQTMDIYWNKSHVREFEVCFNATEFYRGLSFRFQTDGTDNHHQLIGNNYLWFETKQLTTFRKIKLADVLAASSCFPMGFEPIVFPQDYSYHEGEDKKLGVEELREAVHYENYTEQHFPLSYEPAPEIKDDPKQKTHIRSFGLMDGGITDNQGLKSLMLADKKRRARKVPHPFDMIIVTDVASYFMDSYEVPPAIDSTGWRQHNLNYYVKCFQSLIRKTGIWQTVLLLAGIGFGLLSCLVEKVWMQHTALFFSGAVLSLFAVLLLIRSSKGGRQVIGEARTFDITDFIGSIDALKRSFTEGIIVKLANYLKLTRLNVFEQMLKARISSAMIMISDVNLKQVRRLIYEMFYNDSCWDNRRVPNFIYELSTHNKISRTNRMESERRLGWKTTEEDKKLLLDGMHNINTVAENARLMATTLWFDETDGAIDNLKNIVATGQFTTCCNLLEYVISLERKNVSLTAPQQAQLQLVRAQLEADLLQFKADPFFLY